MSVLDRTRRTLWPWLIVAIGGLISWVAFLNLKNHPVAAVLGWTGMVLIALAAFVIPYVTAGWLWLRVASKPWATATVSFAADLLLTLALVALILGLCVKPMLGLLIK